LQHHISILFYNNPTTYISLLFHWNIIINYHHISNHHGKFMIVLELLRFWHFVDFSVYEAEKIKLKILRHWEFQLFLSIRKWQNLKEAQESSFSLYKSFFCRGQNQYYSATESSFSHYLTQNKIKKFCLTKSRSVILL
jgi:hypothetical protein